MAPGRVVRCRDRSAARPLAWGPMEDAAATLDATEAGGRCPIDHAAIAAEQARQGAPAERSLADQRAYLDKGLRRFDALAPYKPALVSLTRSARRDPALACLLHGFATRSQKWTLAAAGIHRGGLAGCATVEGAVLIHLEALRTWLRDDDEDLARTMAALDRGLRRGERAIRILDQVCAFAPRLAERGRRMRDSGRTARASRNSCTWGRTVWTIGTN